MRGFGPGLGASMRAVDTNALVRLIVRDDSGQVEKAEAFVAQAAWVSQLVLAETVRVLEFVYGRTDDFEAENRLEAELGYGVGAPHGAGLVIGVERIARVVGGEGDADPALLHLVHEGDSAPARRLGRSPALQVQVAHREAHHADSGSRDEVESGKRLGLLLNRERAAVPGSVRRGTSGRVTKIELSLAHPGTGRSPGLRFKRRYSGDVHRAFRNRQIVTALQVDPEAGAVAEQLAEPHRHLSGDRLLLSQDVVEGLPRNPERFGHGCLAHRERRQDVLAQYLARMHRLDGRVSLDHR